MAWLPAVAKIRSDASEGESYPTESCAADKRCRAGMTLPPDLPGGWPIQVSYTFTVDFQRENGLPYEDVDMRGHYIEAEMTDPAR
jgi:hypothetical protein